MPPRGPKVITPERLDVVATMLRRAMAPRMIERALAPKWDCSRRTIRNMITRVRLQWQEERAAKASDDDRDEVRQQLDEAIGMAFEMKDPGTAVRGLAEKGRMLGMYPSAASPFERAGGAVRDTALDPDQIRARIAELAQRPEIAGRLRAILVGQKALPPKPV